jgi:hypothetical protein
MMSDSALPSSDAEPLTLLASDHFAKGDAGWLTSTGVWRIEHTSTRPAQGILVIAMEPVWIGTHGQFYEPSGRAD